MDTNESFQLHGENLLKKVKEEAKALHTRSMVIIFEPQPLEFFARGNIIPRLTRFRETRCPVQLRQ